MEKFEKKGENLKGTEDGIEMRAVSHGFVGNTRECL